MFVHYLRRATRQSIAPRLRCSCLILFLLAGLLLNLSGCRSSELDQPQVLPRSLRDVPAEKLAYRLDADTSLRSSTSESEDAILQAVQSDFDLRRNDDALLRTVISPDGQRVLALYATGEMPEGSFRIDLYAVDGLFLRNMTSPDLACAFLPTVAWSPDGQLIAFAARKSSTPTATATTTPLPTTAPPSPIATTTTTTAPDLSAAPVDPAMLPTPTRATGPMFSPVPLFDTEQIYISDRDGFNLRPLTAREGLIYFRFAWAPVGGPPALAALACKEDEWQQRLTEGKLPSGRPRLLMLDGQERLLDDRLTEVVPVWSPDASKIASAFETEIAIYDATINPIAGARLPLYNQLT
ncbi:MAG: hypothetical protein WKF84_26075 [Pyrinomonadaceae bacterium]